jgi:hypothetical protein
LKKIQILKSTGDITGFSEEKLRNSLLKSGAKQDVAETVIKEVKKALYEGIPTRKIYKLAFHRLKQLQPLSAAKYKVKKGIMEPGPAGYVFEKFISIIFESWGFQVRLNQIINGTCVKHELDLVAEKPDLVAFVECKYHNLQGTVCDVKIPLYFHSRFNDITAVQENENRKMEGWLITNTKFTDDAIKYGGCTGLKLLSWSYPPKENLRDIIDRYGLYPVTCLTTVTNREKMLLLEHNMLLCKQLRDNTSLLSDLHVSPQRIEKIMEELSVIS